MDEYIKKHFALDVIKRTSGDYVAAFTEISHADTEPVRQDTKGEWDGKLNYDDPICLYGTCKNCGEYVQAWNFCPSCGANMKK